MPGIYKLDQKSKKSKFFNLKFHSVTERRNVKVIYLYLQ